MKKQESLAEFMGSKFINFDTQLNKFKLNPEKWEVSLDPKTLSEIQKLLPGCDIIDAKMASGQGIGSFGKEKITIAYKEGEAIKFKEFKEQDQDSPFDTLLNHHENSERALVAGKLQVSIQSVEIGGKPYTMKELTPWYAQFKAGDNGENVEFGSKELAVQLGKLLNSDPETASKVLTELQKPEVQTALEQMGREYAERISGALTTARTEYPELAPKPPEVKLETPLETTVATEAASDGWANLREVTDTDMTNLENFYKKYPKGIPQFHKEILKNPDALSALKKILDLPDAATIQEVHKKTYTIQKTLGVTSDGAFGPKSFEKWKEVNKKEKPLPTAGK